MLNYTLGNESIIGPSTGMLLHECYADMEAAVKAPTRVHDTI